MSYEKIAAITPAPALIRFYYLTSVISQRVEKISSYKASATIKQDGKSDYDRIQLSVDEIDLLKDYMKISMLKFFDLLFHIIYGNSIIHDTGVVLTGADRVTSGSFVAGQGYTISGLGSTVSGVTGTASDLTDTILNMNSTAGLKVGMVATKVSGDGNIESGATIVSIDSGTQITLSDVTSAGPIVLSFGPGEITDFKLIGASSNTVGVSFIATGVGEGNGTADVSDFGSYCDIKDNAKYRTINLDIIDKTIEDGIVDYVLARWYNLKNSTEDAQLHMTLYNNALAEVDKRSIALRQYA